MSGVGRQGRRWARGISRSGRSEGTKNGETPAVACLGLDGQGPQAPNKQNERSQPKAVIRLCAKDRYR